MSRGCYLKTSWHHQPERCGRHHRCIFRITLLIILTYYHIFLVVVFRISSLFKFSSLQFLLISVCIQTQFRTNKYIFWKCVNNNTTTKNLLCLHTCYVENDPFFLKGHSIRFNDSFCGDFMFTAVIWGSPGVSDECNLLTRLWV